MRLRTKIIHWIHLNRYYFTTWSVIVFILAYAFELYFDFSGYCDIAMGIGKMFNYDIPRNFNIWNNYGMYGNAGYTKYRYFEEMKAENRADQCKACGACEEVCPQKMPIREHLTRLAEELNNL